MANSLDMSLDDLIKNNKQQFGGGGRGRGRRPGRSGGAGRGRGRRGALQQPHQQQLRVNNPRISSFSMAKVKVKGSRLRYIIKCFDGRITAWTPSVQKKRLKLLDPGGLQNLVVYFLVYVMVTAFLFPNLESFNRTKGAIWQNGLLEDSLMAMGAGGGGNAKLYISNLDYGVSNQDIKELFSEVGELKSSSVHYDRNGRSNGTAEVVFARQNDAVAAMRRYNGVQLDGKPMKIELIGPTITLPVSRIGVPAATLGRGQRSMLPINQGILRPRGVGRGSQGGASFGQRRNRLATSAGRGRGRGGGRGGRGGRGKGRNQDPARSAEDLDKDLENYHAQAMETS